MSITLRPQNPAASSHNRNLTPAMRARAQARPEPSRGVNHLTAAPEASGGVVTLTNFHVSGNHPATLPEMIRSLAARTTPVARRQ